MSENKRKFFQGEKDSSAITLYNVFFDNKLILSTPFNFSRKRSAVYIEDPDGNTEILESLYGYLKKLLNSYIDEPCFGSWIAIVPPSEFNDKIVLYYEAEEKANKVRLLTFILRRHLAGICNLYLSLISRLTVKSNNIIIDSCNVVLPKGFNNGKKVLPNKLPLSKGKIIL